MANSNFNFDEYNKVMADANTGLKIFLAERLLKDVQISYIRFNSPLQQDIGGIVNEIVELRAEGKKAAEAWQKAQNAGPATEDPANPNPVEGKSIGDKNDKLDTAKKEHEEAVAAGTEVKSLKTGTNG